MKTTNGHILYVKDDFKDIPYEKLENNQTYNLVVDGGLSICKVCGEYEAGLDKPCKKKEIQKSDFTEKQGVKRTVINYQDLAVFIGYVMSKSSTITEESTVDEFLEYLEDNSSEFLLFEVED